MKKLFVFANAFPFGDWEPFLETEIEYYRKFDQVHIFSLSVRPDQAKSRRVIKDPRVIVHPIAFKPKSFYALYAARTLSDPSLYRELKLLLRQRRLSPGRLVQLLVFLSRCHYEASQILTIIEREHLASPDDQITLYSYRMAYQPYLTELVSRNMSDTRRVARAHRADLYEEFAPNGYLPLRTQTVAALDRLYLISEHGYNYLRHRHPDAAERMAIRYLGTQDHGLGPMPQSRQPLQVVTCSNLFPWKRVGLFIDALVELGDVSVKWTHFGDGPLRDELEERARQELGPTIEFDFRGPVSNPDLLAEYARVPYHVLVNVSESEGIPVSIMEASSFGIPAIATDVGGTSEVVEDGVNGILLPSSPHPSAIADALRSMATMNEAEYERNRINARELWERKYDADHNYRQFTDELALRL